MQSRLENIFSEVQKIQATNKDNTAPEDFIASRFAGYMLRAIIYDSDFRRMLSANHVSMNENRQFLFLHSALTEEVGAGNCQAQSALFVAKLLLADMDVSIALIGIYGRGIIQGQASVLNASQHQHDHAFTIVGYNTGLQDGYIIDTWALDGVKPNSGVQVHAKNIGFTSLDSAEPIIEFKRRLSVEEWSTLSRFYSFLSAFLTDKKLLEIAKEVKPIIMNEVKTYFDVTTQENVIHLVEIFFSNDNLHNFNVNINNAFLRWKTLSEKTTHAVMSSVSTLFKPKAVMISGNADKDGVKLKNLHHSSAIYAASNGYDLVPTCLTLHFTDSKSAEDYRSLLVQANEQAPCKIPSVFKSSSGYYDLELSMSHDAGINGQTAYDTLMFLDKHGLMPKSLVVSYPDCNIKGLDFYDDLNYLSMQLDSGQFGLLQLPYKSFILKLPLCLRSKSINVEISQQPLTRMLR